MKYDVITIDTQAIETNGFHFEGGLLALLKQFNGGPIEVVVSSIVAREVLNHLTEKTREAREALERATIKAAEYGLVASARPNYSHNPVDPRAIARSRLEKFLVEIGAQIIPVDGVTTAQLLSLYFASAPPFGARKKKQEFPDAIALLTLEAWAKEKGKKILAISGDPDWAAYSEKSDRIDVVSELALGLELAQQHISEANTTVEHLIRDVINFPGHDFSRNLHASIAEQVNGWWAYGEAESSYQADCDQVELTLVDLRFKGEPNDLDFTVVQAGPEKIVARIGLDLNVKAEASFSLSAYDSTDKDYFAVGVADAEMERDMEFSALVTFEGDFEKDEVRATEVEIVEGPASVNFGSVEPDYGEPEAWDPPDAVEAPDLEPEEDDAIPW